MSVDSLVVIVAMWCSVEDTRYTKESRQACVESAVNSECIDNAVLQNKLTEDKDKLDTCVSRARGFLVRAVK